MGSSFRFVDDMGVAPFGRRAVLQVAVATALPFLPLLLFVLPMSEIVQVLTKLVL